MYSPRRSYGSPPPELSNNPFIDHQSNALARFPDINVSDTATGSTQYTSWMQSSASANSNPGYMSPPNAPYYPSSPQPQPTLSAPQGYQGSIGGSGFSSPSIQSQPTGLPFQPTSSFGQQLAGHINGAYGGPPQQQQQPQYNGYPSNQQYGQGFQGGYPNQPQSQQQQQPNSQYLSEFDPYASTPGGTQSLAAGSGQGQTGGTSYNAPHPRDYIRQHKIEMEQWDQYSWKQALNSFEALKEAWGARKRELEARARALGGAGLFGGGYGSMYGGQGQQMAQLEQMAKEAESNFDSVAASTFQMQEVFTGYRTSGDMASKRRVREAINASLASLPDWPRPLY